MDKKRCWTLFSCPLELHEEEKRSDLLQEKNEIPNGYSGGQENEGKTHHHNKKENQQKPKTFFFIMEIFEPIVYF